MEIYRESAGETWIGCKKIGRKQRSKMFSFVMQDADYQLFTESVEDELRFDNTKGNFEERIEEALVSLDLKEFRQRHPLSLSGGQKQRVTIASAAMSAAPIIIFDEPTSGLDGEHMRKVGGMLQTLVEKGKSIVVISHDMEILMDTCESLIRIQSS